MGSSPNEGHLLDFLMFRLAANPEFYIACPTPSPALWYHFVGPWWIPFHVDRQAYPGRGSGLLVRYMKLYLSAE